MSRPRPLFLLGALWELARFIVLFALIMWQSEENRLSLIRVLWFGAAQLALVPAFAFLGWNPRRYARYARLLASAKVISIVPGIGLAAILLPELHLFVNPVRFLPFYLPAIAIFLVLLVDVIFLVILIRLDRPRKTEAVRDDPVYPDYDETEIEDI